jgi:hypothetical protein
MRIDTWLSSRQLTRVNLALPSDADVVWIHIKETDEVCSDIYYHRLHPDTYVIRNVARPSTCKGMVHRALVRDDAIRAPDGVTVALGLCTVVLSLDENHQWSCRLVSRRADISRVALECPRNTKNVEMEVGGAQHGFQLANIIAERAVGERVAEWRLYWD